MPPCLPLCAPVCRSWNAFGGNLSEEVVCSTAKLMRELGLVEAGYRWGPAPFHPLQLLAVGGT